jgi:hypothetical protein
LKLRQATIFSLKPNVAKTTTKTKAGNACNKFHYEFLRSRVWSACGAGFTWTQGNVCKKSDCENHKSTQTTTKTKTATEAKTTNKAKTTTKAKKKTKAKITTRTNDKYLLAEAKHACNKFHYEFLRSRVWSACGAGFTRTQDKGKSQVGEDLDKDKKTHKSAKTTTKTHTHTKRKTTNTRQKQDKDDDKKTRRRIRQRHAQLYQSIKRRGVEKSEEL